MPTPNKTFFVIFPTTTHELETRRINYIRNIRFDVEFFTGNVTCIGVSDFYSKLNYYTSASIVCEGVSDFYCNANFFNSASVVMTNITEGSIDSITIAPVSVT